MKRRPPIVTVSKTGQVLAVANGETAITIAVAGTSQSIPVKVTGISDRPAIGFTEQVLPILSKAGCNAGACHASQFGKGGFKLSVFASEPTNDHLAIARGEIGRRISPIDPARSLLLLKPTMQVPHGGGRRLEAGSVDGRILEQWIAAGAPGPAGNAPAITDMEVFPAHRIGQMGLTQQLRVTAKYSDGKTRDVTAWAKFDSTDEG